tara:strand:- start:11970 stop:12752 length:783 start_codon:yes stop_codon:yes gene_type:complete
MNDLEKEFNVLDLRPKDSLHPSFWDGEELSSDVRERLLMIAQGAIDKLELGVDILDITLTGSMASYGWHENSDLDLHIVLNFEYISDDYMTVSKMLNFARIIWNKKHDIYINGHEVEIYYQDVAEPHHALGIFSLLENRWLKKPEPLDHDFDLKSSEKKAEGIAESIIHAEELLEEGEFEDAHKYCSKIFRKIKKMRKSGLERDGIYSNENLAFKILRGSNLIDRLTRVKNDSYDKMMSLNPKENKNIFLNKWASFLGNM